MITEEQFKKQFGIEPEQDDLDRVNCTKAGNAGHWSCGVCDKHNKPRFICGCLGIKVDEI